jgi:hypothetical protein
MFNISELFGQRLEVYRDLRKGHLCWSIRSPKGKKPVLNYHGTGLGRQKDRTQQVGLKNCVFTVKEGGPAKVRLTRKKYVHAWVTGVLVDAGEVREFCTKRVTYDPYKFESFVTVEEPNTPIRSAEMVLFEYPSVFVSPDAIEGMVEPPSEG